MSYDDTIRLGTSPWASPDARMAASVAALSVGNFKSGWALYESRWDFPDYPGNNLKVDATRLMNIQEAKGKRLLLWNEQGAGDIIQMLRFVPTVARDTAGLVLAVHPELKRLASCVPGVETVVTDGDVFEAVDCHAPIMSLPFFLRTRFATLPAPAIYLRPPSAVTSTWKARLGSARRFRVGLAVSRTEGDERSAPLRLLEPLLRLARMQFHILQHTLSQADRQWLAGFPNVVTYTYEISDLADTAALIDGMDLVITLDPVLAHLTGALGKPVWVLLPAASHWVWMIGRDNSPWYPTARLFRRTAAEGWNPVIRRVQDALWKMRPSIVI